VLNKRLEIVKLTGRFKVKAADDLLDLFDTYRRIVNELLEYAYHKGITSFKRIKSGKYHELRRRHPNLPSHYIYTACQMVASIYKSYRKRERRGRAKGKPVFKKDTILLDDHLFMLDIDRGIVKLSTPNGRICLEAYKTKYHEKFRDWRVGQAWLVRRENGIFLNVVFSKEVEISDAKDFVGIDLNENNITISMPEGFIQLVTREKEIRASYYVKRKRIQKKVKGEKRRELLKKYGKREKNKINDLYHKIANKVVELAGRSGIALEDLRGIRDLINYSRELNGRLHRWGFRKLQSIIEYKAKLKGIEVAYVDPSYTSSLCPICGVKLSPNGHRVLRCRKCGLETDRDVIGSWNIRLKALKMWGVTVPPESLPMKPEGGRLVVTKVTANQNG